VVLDGNHRVQAVKNILLRGESQHSIDVPCIVLGGEIGHTHSGIYKALETPVD
jgi:hypothetical protein